MSRPFCARSSLAASAPIPPYWRRQLYKVAADISRAAPISSRLLPSAANPSARRNLLARCPPPSDAFVRHATYRPFFALNGGIGTREPPGPVHEGPAIWTVVSYLWKGDFRRCRRRARVERFPRRGPPGTPLDRRPGCRRTSSRAPRSMRRESSWRRGSLVRVSSAASIPNTVACSWSTSSTRV